MGVLQETLRRARVGGEARQRHMFCCSLNYQRANPQEGGTFDLLQHAKVNL